MKNASAAPAAREHAVELPSAEGGAAARPADAHASLLSLGSAIGNRRLGHALSAGLRIGGADDGAEREARRAADRAVGAAPGSRTADAAAPAGHAPALVHRVLQGPGRPLPADTRALMESRLGHGFGHVRVHTDAAAAESARQVRAAAWTVGADVAFAGGRYQPETTPGRRLIAHELAHVVQQASSAPVLQRQAAETVSPAQHLEKLYAELEAHTGKPPGPKLKEWARKAQEAMAAMGKQLEYTQLYGAWTRLKFHGSLPDLPREPVPFKFPPGAVRANEILPFARGTRLQITHLMDKVLDSGTVERVRSLAAAAEMLQGTSGPRPLSQGAGLEEIIRSRPRLVLDLILSPDVAKSAVGVIEESSDEEVKLSVDVPAVAAAADRPAIPAFKGTILVQVNERTLPEFALEFGWSGGPQTFRMWGLKATRNADGSILIDPGKSFKLQVSRQAEGGIALQAVGLGDLVTNFLRVKEPVKLVDISPLKGPAGSPEAAAQVRQARAHEPVRSGAEIFGGPTLQYDFAAQRARALASVGWRLTYRPLGDWLGVPIQFQVDYSPQSSAWAEVTSGVQTTIPSRVPVTFRLLTGVRAGSLEEPEGPGPFSRLPVLGPTVGVGTEVRVSPVVSVQMHWSYFQNLLKEADAAEKSPAGAGAVHLGSVFHF
jgi:hypothetical protein